jgi:bifunctional UDP-N-acetylglucosamine pyrophosphorylase/glucosamine-1-phosphate N-acetyltransferase
MKSAVPKVLHPIAARSMLGHVLAAVAAAGIEDAVVVAGPGRADVEAEARRVCPGAAVVVQHERRGTAHAVLAAREHLARQRHVVVLYGDTPLIRPETIRRLLGGLAGGAAVSVLGFRAAKPEGYGRLVMEGPRLLRIVEERDATAEERAIDLCNAGMMALAGTAALDLLEAIGSANAKGEFYLTDAVEIAAARGLASVATLVDGDEVHGVNDRGQLAAAEAVVQRRLRQRAMEEGATLVSPETVFLAHDTTLGRDVLIEPFCVFGPGVTVGDGAVIHAFSHLEGAVVEGGASVGPYARLRPGTRLAAGSKIGNFVEVKAGEIGAGAKVNHLSYIGDATVGAGANIGAGTITCNYDGFFKERTTIGAGAFIGSNSALVAPVTVGDNATVGAGSVITRDVAADALAVSRSRQMEKAGWAAQFRARRAREKAEKAKR